MLLRSFLTPALLALTGLAAPLQADAPRLLRTLAEDARAFVAADGAAGEASPAPPAPVTGGRHYTRAADGLFYVHALVNGRPIRFVLDTGASVVVLTGRDAATLGLRPTASDAATIRTVAGESRMSWTSLDTVVVGARTVSGVQAAIVADGLPVSLMGQNMLARLGPVTIEGGSLRFD